MTLHPQEGIHLFRSRSHAHEWLEANGWSYDVDQVGDGYQATWIPPEGTGLEIEDDGPCARGWVATIAHPDTPLDTMLPKYDHRDETA
jgi:hypothetical protein